MNLVLNGGVSPNQQRKSPLLSHGMLQAQQQQQQHTVTSEKPLMPSQYLPANMTAKPLLASPPPYQLPNQLSMNANAALFAQQQAQAQLIAQQNLLAHHQQASAASVSHMPGFTLIPHSAASAMHGTNSLVAAQSQLMSQSSLSQHVQNLASLNQQHQMPPNLVSNLMSRSAAGYPSAAMQTAQAMQSPGMSPAGISQTLSHFALSPGLPFHTFQTSMSPYTNQMLLSPHSLASLQLKAPQSQMTQARTYATPSHTHTHAHTLQQQHQAAALQQMSPMPAQMANFQHQLSMNANAAAASSLMHSIKRSYESAFHQDPAAQLHHQKRPTQFTGTGIL